MITVKMPPKKARAAEELEELVDETGQLAVLKELSVLVEISIGSVLGLVSVLVSVLV